jgi:tetratricopeptide (TPR) repeat protein
MVDETLAASEGAPDDIVARLLRSKARARAADPASGEQASEAYQTLIERFGDERDVLHYEKFIESKSSADERHDDLRWVFGYRARNAEDPLPALMAWAKAEDDLGYVDEAIEIYERILERDGDHDETLEAIARLRALKGDVEGAIAAIQTQRRLASSTTQQASLDRRLATLLVDELGRPQEALEQLFPGLSASPPDDEAIAIARRALTSGCSPRAVERIEEAIEANKDPGSARANLELLIDSPRGAWLDPERISGWYERLAALCADDAETAVDVIKRGLAEFPASTPLWQKLEGLARGLDRPNLLAAVYQQTLDTHALEPETVELLGRRVVDFCEEWSAGDPGLVTTLAHVLGRVPGARWALDRVKVALAAEGRWDDLFDLYDAAIANSDDDDTRARLLEEAAVAARDLAGAPECAMGYLERLHELRPEDMATQTSLERLYQRHGMPAKLIELISSRLDRSAGVAHREIEARLASLCLEVGDLERASELVDAALAEGTEVGELVPLLEQIVEKGQSASLAVREHALGLLRSHYSSSGRAADVIRIAELELRCATDPTDRGERL